MTHFPETYKSVRRAARQLPKSSATRKALRTAYWKSIHAMHELSLAGSYLRYRIRQPVSIVVLGMHRSGTSCLTRIINLCGARAGDRLLGQMDSNLRGHWEHVEALNINRDVLARSGGAWDDPPASVGASIALRLRMRRFLAQLHQGTQPAVWKDPRTTLTYPAWKPLIARPTLVALFRHPVSVAQSLQKRENFSLERGLRLWLDYNRRLLQIAEREDVLFVDFDGGLGHIDASIRQLVRHTPLHYDAAALDFYDDSLRSADRFGDIPDATIESVYAELQRYAAR
jgi:hypothetical protein